MRLAGHPVRSNPPPTMTPMLPDHRILPVLIVHDGKPGHRAQAEGLSCALTQLREAVCWEYNCAIKNPFPQMDEAPKLVVSVGRHSSGDALRYARQFGARKVALMNPGWWKRRQFDLCVVPRHDGLKEGPKLLATDGALNAVAATPEAPLDRGLILIGGPSAHYRWDEAQLMAQLRLILQRSPEVTAFTATSSRRTPDPCLPPLRALAAEFGDRFHFIPASETPRGWVAAQLAVCGTCWVGEDSVSMVYEALSAGAAVGLLDMPPAKGKPGRVARGVRALAARGMVVPFAAWKDGQPLQRQNPLREAERVADEILKRWPEL